MVDPLAILSGLSIAPSLIGFHVSTEYSKSRDQSEIPTSASLRKITSPEPQFPHL